MKITEIIKLDDCFDGSSIRELVLDSRITEQAVFNLAPIGQLEYHGNYSRPFFKISKENAFHLRGVVGYFAVKVEFTKRLNRKELNEFYSTVNNLLSKAA